MVVIAFEIKAWSPFPRTGSIEQIVVNVIDKAQPNP